MVMTPTSDNTDSMTQSSPLSLYNAPSESQLDVSIPYVDTHYGSADGIIDPTEYSVEYTDPITGVSVHLEHNGTVLFVGLEAFTTGWIAFGWQNYTSGFSTEGLNGSDLIYGYVPGETPTPVTRVTGSEVVTVHYVLKLRNGTFFQDGEAPGDDSTTPIRDEGLLQDYKDQIIGMRIGETRHFVIPADKGYTRVTDQLYGEDLEYIITLTRIGSDFINPADSSDIVYSDEYGISTYQHLPDDDQDRVLAANGTDDGTRTQLEYFIQMDSDDLNDIPFINSTELHYPLTVMFGDTEDITGLPVQHSSWAEPVFGDFTPNGEPSIDIISHEQDAVINWVADFEVAVTDNSFIRRVECRIDEDAWLPLEYDFKTYHWITTIDLSVYSEDDHVATFRAYDASNTTGITTLDFSIERPYVPFLGMRVEVDRTVNTQLFHTTATVDAFKITNNGSAPIGAIELYLPLEYSINFMSITGADSDGNKLQIVRLDDSDGMMHWRIHFFQSVGYGEEYNFNIISVYHSLSWLKEFETYLYGLKFLKFPIVPYVLTEASLTIDFRSGDTPEGTQPDTTVSNIAPMTIVEFELEMSSYTPLIVGYRTTEVTLDPWGWMNYKETITIENNGPARENVLLFTVPAYAIGIKIYDEVGVLAASQPGAYEWNETLPLQINLKNDRFGEDGFWPGYSYTFHITFSVQMAAHQEAITSGNLIEIPMGTMGELVVIEHQVDIIVPDSLGVVDLNDGYRKLYGVFETTYRFIHWNSTSHNPFAVSMTYVVSIGSLSRPIVFATFIGLIALAYVSLRKVEVAAETLSSRVDDDSYGETRQTGAPPDLLRKFASLYSRKTSLNIDIEKLEASRRRGKMKQREYMIRDRDLKAQIETIDSELPAIRDELIGYGSRYRDMIGQLELENEKIEGAKAGLRQLLRRKKKAQISRAAFEKIRQDYLKTIKKATTTTDRVLMSLQEEAGDI